jgi:ABC-type multidrug transport system ATPase subunit
MTGACSDRARPEILRVANLAKRYVEEQAIADVTFAVRAGEVFGIVGPNGAGKTTLLEVVAGLVAAESGGISWRGEDMRVPHRKEAMFYLPDGVRPYQDRYATDVVSFFASIYGRSRADGWNADRHDADGAGTAVRWHSSGHLRSKVREDGDRNSRSKSFDIAAETFFESRTSL